MDPVGQGSFIPKQALTAQAARGSGLGLLVMITVLVFVMSIVAAGAAYGYKYILQGTLASKDADLRRQEGAFDAAAIQDLARMDSRIAQAKTLMHKHISPSAIFYFLSTITLERVQFGTFNYTLLPSGAATISLSGVADSFSSVALQSDQFGASKVLSDVVFSGITVEPSGKVSFSVEAKVDPQLINYERNLSQSAAAATQTLPE